MNPVATARKALRTVPMWATSDTRAASADAHHVRIALSKVYQALWEASFGGRTTMSPGEALLRSSGQAVRWLIHRRRQYLLEDDGVPTTIGFAWISKADRVVAGSPITKESGTYLYAKIDDDSYDDYRN